MTGSEVASPAPRPVDAAAAGRDLRGTLARLLPDALLSTVLRWALRGLAASVPVSIAASGIAFGLALAAWLARVALHGGPRWPSTIADRPFLAFLGCGVLAAIAGLDAGTALWSLRGYAQILVFYVVVANVRDDNERHRLAWIVSIALFLWGWHRVYDYRWQNFLHGVGPGKMTQASQLAIGVVLLQALWLATRGAGKRIAVAFAYGMQLAGLVCTFKRGAWVGAIAGLTTQLWFRNRKLVLVPLAIAAVVGLGYGPARLRLIESGDDFVHPDNRLRMWTIGAQLIRDYPLGIGTHNGTIMKRADLWGTDAPKHRHFHSNFITVWVEDGILGLIAFGFWLVAIARMLVARVVATRDGPPREAALAMGAATAFLAWNLNGIVEFNFGDAEVMMLLYLVLGLALAPQVPSAAGEAELNRLDAEETP